MTSPNTEQATRPTAQEFVARINEHVGLADALASGLRGADYDLPIEVAAAWDDLEVAYRRVRGASRQVRRGRCTRGSDNRGSHR